MKQLTYHWPSHHFRCQYHISLRNLLKDEVRLVLAPASYPCHRKTMHLNLCMRYCHRTL
uniref:Uncharacterized protein n=1 Tax=Arundo donax TaxID=35708 RepID=A0A0A9DDK4_ARUDO